MNLKKLITGLIASLFLANLAIADSSTNYTVDVSELNSGGNVSSSTSYKINDTFIGFVDGDFGYSSSYTLGSGLVFLELLCGNGILELGEQCDDGNVTSGDGCSSICRTEPTLCGNGILEAGEQCDDGNVISGDGCSSACVIEIAPIAPGGGGVVPLCGNGIREGSEQCDDGNNVSGDGCNSICLSEKPEIIIRQITIKARPEKRAQQKWGLTEKAVFYHRGLQKTVLETMVENDDFGLAYLELVDLPDGIYDVWLKGQSHLSKVLRQVEIKERAVTLDFTFGETFYLIAGDVHESKDNFINSLDITAVVNQLYTSNIDADLNRDGIVNALDISIVVNNLYKSGEGI